MIASQSEAGGQVRDAERDRPDVEVEVTAALEARQELGEAERQDELERHDDDDQEQRVPDRLAEVEVVRHLAEVVERPAAGLVAERDEHRLDQRPGEEDQHEERCSAAGAGRAAFARTGARLGSRRRLASLLPVAACRYSTGQGPSDGASGCQQGAPAACMMPASFSPWVSSDP